MPTKVSYPIAKYSRPMTMCNVCQPARQFVVEDSQDFRDLTELGDIIQLLSKMKVGLTVRFEISPSA